MTIHAFNSVPSIPGGPQERKVRSISDLRAGDYVRVGYREWQPTHNDKFEGFKVEGTEPLYCNMADLKMATGGVNPEQVRAVLTSKSDAGTWEAYRYNGRWCVGSSADPAKLYNPVLILSAGPMRAA